MSVDPVTSLLTRQDALLTEIAAGSTKPTYSVNGQNVDWPAYRKWLYEELGQVQTSLQMFQPFEIRTIAM